MPLEIDKDGNRFWFNSKSKRHRLDGPAVEWSNGNKSWFINGKEYTEKEYVNG